MTNANWGGPRAGQSGYPQQGQQGHSHHPHAQDPAWHGQPPVTRQEPRLQAQRPAAPQSAPMPQQTQQRVAQPQPQPQRSPQPTMQRPAQPTQPARQPQQAQAGQGRAPQPQMQAQPRQPQPRQPQPQPQPRQMQTQPQVRRQAPAQPAPQPQAQQYRAAPEQYPNPYQQAQAQPQHGYAAPHEAYGQPHYDPAPQYHEAAYYAAPDEGVADRGRVAGFMNGVGAILSIALVGGLAVWGYQLAMRDVTEVPVIAALEGPMRIQPDNPGGEDAEHQGLAVNNVTAEGAAEGPARQLVLAPPAERLEENDAPAVSSSTIEATPTAEAGDSQPKLGTEPLDAAVSADDAEAAARAMAEQIAAGSAPLSGDEADLSMTPEAEERALAAARSGDIVQPSVPGVAASPRPRARPTDLVTRAAASPSSDALLAATREATREVAPSDIPAGTRLVQLGAFDTEDVARAEWDTLNGRFAEYLEGKSRVIEQAQSGGKTFYRLRAMGFDDLSEARRLCSALTAAKASCIPVVTR
ncbi:MAG: SPOR domain-containing protein [Maritimibacter sp.]|uniref:SPOR domain-containing protein n=2 Tax=Maritimibacter TaxID=404235 RepID=UPI001DAF30B1|nr:SPOR domain-containing protein [Maritimibacter sp.]MBL6429399.1 SPOR domain-containing protein [Maritimibacter sp.]